MRIHPTPFLIGKRFQVRFPFRLKLRVENVATNMLVARRLRLPGTSTRLQTTGRPLGTILQLQLELIELPQEKKRVFDDNVPSQPRILTLGNKQQ